MNPSANSADQQGGEPNWGPDTWESAAGAAVSGLETTRSGVGGGGNGSSGGRMEPTWDTVWENSPIIQLAGQVTQQGGSSAPSSVGGGGGGSDIDLDIDNEQQQRKPQHQQQQASPQLQHLSAAGAAASMASNLRAYSSIMSSPGFPPAFSHNPLGIFSSAGIRSSFNGMDAVGIGGGGGSSSSSGGLASSGIPGLAATSGGGHGDVVRASYEQQRRRYYGHPMDLVDKAAAGVHLASTGVGGGPSIKQEEVSSHSHSHGGAHGGHGHAHGHSQHSLTGGGGGGGGSSVAEMGPHTRIGLNLGVRTYFSTEDTAAGRLSKRQRANSPGSQVPMCQAEGCKTDLTQAKHYHRRHKVCELHSKASNVVVANHTQRFCQQCSRFHLLTEFDEGKRSCRKRLADHNRRRRKPQPTVSTTVPSTPESLALVKVEEQDSRVNGSGGSLHRPATTTAYGRSSDDRMQSLMMPGGGLALGCQARQNAPPSFTTSGLDIQVPWLRNIGSMPSSRSTSDNTMPGQPALSRSGGLTLQSHGVTVLQPGPDTGTGGGQQHAPGGGGTGGSSSNGNGNDSPSAPQVFSQNLLASSIAAASRAGGGDLTSTDQWAMLGTMRAAAAQSDREQREQQQQAATQYGASAAAALTVASAATGLQLDSAGSQITSADSSQPQTPSHQQQQQQGVSCVQTAGSLSAGGEQGDGAGGAGGACSGASAVTVSSHGHGGHSQQQQHAPDMKYSDLQALARPPFAASSLIYDNHHNILNHGVSHFMMG